MFDAIGGGEICLCRKRERELWVDIDGYVEIYRDGKVGLGSSEKERPWIGNTTQEQLRVGFKVG